MVFIALITFLEGSLAKSFIKPKTFIYILGITLTLSLPGCNAMTAVS